MLSAPVNEYLRLAGTCFSSKSGDFVINTPNGVNHFGAILNVKEYSDATYPGILNGLKYLTTNTSSPIPFSPWVVMTRSRCWSGPRA